MTRRLLPIRTVLEGKDWLGQLIGGKSFTVRRTLLIASMGEPLTPEELETFTAVTGRTEAPQAPCEELWIIGKAQRQVSRRGRPCCLFECLRRLSRRFGARRARHRGSQGRQHSASRSDSQFLEGHFHSESALCCESPTVRAHRALSPIVSHSKIGLTSKSAQQASEPSVVSQALL